MLKILITEYLFWILHIKNYSPKDTSVVELENKVGTNYLHVQVPLVI